ncbi:anaphase-promoting complex subunit cdc27 [Basidiobolus ranarum]|uniref:Anaphase-promoting complex subunit cdc27 n=1 Tax=Basidiobolus ranarum TaxID=34480 RepID=A0ABR2W271_9FUNG
MVSVNDTNSHLKNLIWYFLDNDLMENATFYAEKYKAQEPIDTEATELLGYCLLRLGKIRRASRILENSPTPSSRHLLAKTYFKLEEFEKAEEIWLSLLEDKSLHFPKLSLDAKSKEARTFLPDISVIHYLLGSSFKKSRKYNEAIHHFSLSLKLNPFNWSAFDALNQLKNGSIFDPETVYKSLQARQLLGVDDIPEFRLSRLPARKPEPGLDTHPKKLSFQLPPVKHKINAPQYSSPTLASESRVNQSKPSLLSFKPPKGPKADPFINSSKRIEPKQSSRLKFGYSNASSMDLKEEFDLKSQGMKPPKYSKPLTASKNYRSLSDDDDPFLPEKPILKYTKNQVHAADKFLNNLIIIGKGTLLLNKFECRKAIDCFKKLPEEQYNSCWVLLQVAKAHFELAEYKEANAIFQRIRSSDPHYTEGMEIYSTVLWHLRNEVDLSILAHDLSDSDRDAPQTWCVVGNCFSLQHDHISAIKCFKRATQVHKTFSYAHTLSGHEYMAMEDYENAEKQFREAIHLNPRHYNAWYGMGSVSLKNGKIPMAKYHFQKAVGINPRNPVLLCCMGSVCCISLCKIYKYYSNSQYRF